MHVFVTGATGWVGAIETIDAVLEGSARPLLVSSGVALLAPGRAATEQDAPPTPSPFPRKSEDATERF